MTEHQPFPLARVEGLVVTTVKDETLVFDQERSQIHHLNATVATLWALCDGTHSPGALSNATGLDSVAVAEGLSQLATTNLLVGSTLPSSPPDRRTRRRFLRNAVAGGIALPAIVSLTAPAAAQQSSCEGEPVDYSNCGVSGNEGRCCWDQQDCAGVCRGVECVALSPLCGTS